MWRAALGLMTLVGCSSGPAGSCFEQSQAVDVRIASYVSSYQSGCARDEDCALADAGVSCHRRCPQAVMADHVSLLGTQLAALEAEYCSGACDTSQGCVPSSARCQLGRCATVVGPPPDAGPQDAGVDGGGTAADAGP